MTMARYEYGRKLEELAAEYASAKQAVLESPLIRREGDKLFFNDSSGESIPPIVHNYYLALISLQAMGIPLEPLQLKGCCMMPYPHNEKYMVEVMPFGRPYPAALVALQEACLADSRCGQAYALAHGQWVRRPLTVEENMIARIGNALEHPGEKSPLWGYSLSSCSAFIGGPDGKFKIEKISRTLLELKSVEHLSYGRLIVPYDDVVCDDNCREFDKNKDKYGPNLTWDGVMHHELWSFLSPQDTLGKYMELFPSATPRRFDGMNIILRSEWRVGEVLPLSLGDGLCTLHFSSLLHTHVFVRVAGREVDTQQSEQRSLVRRLWGDL